MTSGAMMDSSFEDIKDGASRRLRNLGKDLTDQSLTNKMLENSSYGIGRRWGKEWREFLFGVDNKTTATTPSINQPSYNQSNSRDIVVNFFDKDGNPIKSVRTPVTMTP